MKRLYKRSFYWLRHSELLVTDNPPTLGLNKRRNYLMRLKLAWKIPWTVQSMGVTKSQTRLNDLILTHSFPGGRPAGSPTPRLRRASWASVGPPASSAPHSRWPASSMLRCRRGRICPHKTLALGGAFLSSPTPGKDLGLSPTLQRMNLKSPGRFPYFS